MLIFHLWVNLIPQFAASRHPTGKDKTENYINTRKLNAAQLNRQTDRQTDRQTIICEPRPSENALYKFDYYYYYYNLRSGNWLTRLMA